MTGKGGTGKTTVAAALALALAGADQQVLLCEVEGRQGIARTFDVDPLPYSEQRLATGLADESGRAGRVFGLHIQAEEALLEYLAMYYRLGGRGLDRFGVIEFATTIAPGVRDVLLCGKVYEAVQRSGRNKGARNYDAVVLDAPPTGRIAQFLGVSDELAGLARVGPIKHQADRVTTLLKSERTAVHMVTLLEEMPVQEARDGIEQLRTAGLQIGGVIVNQVRPQDLSHATLSAARAGKLRRTQVAADLESVGLPSDPALIDSLIAEAADHAERRSLEERQRMVVHRLRLPTVELPRIAAGIDLGSLYELAGILREEGMA